MTKHNLNMLRELVASQGLAIIARDANMAPNTLLRLLSSDVVSVHAGTEALAIAYLAKARA